MTDDEAGRHEKFYSLVGRMTSIQVRAEKELYLLLGALLGLKDDKLLHYLMRPHRHLDQKLSFISPIFEHVVADAKLVDRWKALRMELARLNTSRGTVAHSDVWSTYADDELNGFVAMLDYHPQHTVQPRKHVDIYKLEADVAAFKIATEEVLNLAQAVDMTLGHTSP